MVRLPRMAGPGGGSTNFATTSSADLALGSAETSSGDVLTVGETESEHADQARIMGELVRLRLTNSQWGARDWLGSLALVQNQKAQN